MTKIKIHITKDVLEKTKMCVPEERTTNCAISFAIRELFPNAMTCCDVIYFNDSNTLYSDLPYQAEFFIGWFDESTPEERLEIPEMSFDIEVPDEALKDIDISEVYRILKDSKTISLCE